MLCVNCSKLSILPASRECRSCKSKLFTNMQIICDNCSDKNKTCSICMKKMQNSIGLKLKFSGCGNCGK